MNKKLLVVLCSLLCFAQSIYACVPTITIQTSTGSLNFCTANVLNLSAALTTFGGATPTYQWYKNGVAITGATGSVFSASGTSVAVGDVYYCQMISNDPCASPTLAVSNSLALNVTLAPTPALAINTSTFSNTYCAGVNVVFFSSLANAGAGSTRQWKVNGVPVGSGPSYSSSTLVNGDVVTCTGTSILPCVSPSVVTSSPITMVINPSVQPNVAISSPNAVGCSGTPIVNFTATSTNGGTTPAYTWFVNGAPAGVTGASFNSSAIVNGDVVTCNLTSNAFCAVPNKDTSNAITVTVLPAVTPTIIIVEDLNPTCGSSTINFNATITNGGSAPTYQWKKNGVNVGTDTSWYSGSFFTNNDVITCVLTSNAQCATSTIVTSNAVTLSIIAPVTPTVSILATPGNTICFGQTVTYTATITNGGANPTFLWKVNGVPIIGSNANTYSSNTIPNGSLIGVLLTSSIACVTGINATSNTLPLTVKPLLTPTITITSNKTNICNGQAVSFGSATTVSGAAPTYQWKVNGVNVGTSANAYNTSALPVGINTITCTMVSSSNQCLTGNTVTSNQIIVTVNPLLTPTITITASTNNVCYGTPITFTSTITNGGTTPIYKWRINGLNVAGNNATINSVNINNGDVVTCIITSSETCVTKAKDTSNAIVMQIKPLVTPIIVTKRDTDFVCQNDLITFTIQNTFNGGITPVYQWYLNGLPTGNSNTIYSSSTFTSGSYVYCTMTSSAECPNPPIAQSGTDTIHIYAPAVPFVTIQSSDTNTCIGTNIVFTTNSVDGGGAPFYQWYWNGLPHSNNASSYANILLETGDSIFVVMNSNAPCLTKPNDTSNSITMKVQDNITPTISLTPSINAGAAGTPIVYTATTTVLPSYSIQWFRNNALMTTTNSTNTWATTIVNSYDSIYAKIYNFTGCYLATSATSKQLRLGALAIAGYTPANFAVYPNPVQNLATVQGINYGDEMTVYDMTGKAIIIKTIDKNDTYQLDMSGLANGLYQAKFVRGNQHWVVRLIKN
jgi:Secretion system C-terminal sorting domain